MLVRWENLYDQGWSKISILVSKNQNRKRPVVSEWCVSEIARFTHACYVFIYLILVMRKPVLSYANDKGASRSLINAFVFRCLDSITSIILATSKLSRLQLVSVAEQAGLCLTWSPKNNNNRIRVFPWRGSFIYLSHVMRKSVYAICEQQRRRSAIASAQSDQNLCCSLPR